MTKFLIIRHGQSQANLDGVFAGHTDTPLTELGRRQAALTAEYIVAHGAADLVYAADRVYAADLVYAADRVYASDLARAFDTAKASADRLGLPVIPDEGLREIYAGEWEGVPFDELQKNGGEPWRVWREDIGRAVCPGGESAVQLQARVVATLDRIARENENRTVIIGTHATPIRTLMCHCMGKPIESMQELTWVPNASVTTVLWEDGKFTLVRAGYAEHLREHLSSLPSNV